MGQANRTLANRGLRSLLTLPLFVTLALTLTYPASAQAAVDTPKHFKIKEFLQYEKSHIRSACGTYGGDERCASYSAMCRKYTKGRIECYTAMVLEDEDHIGSLEGLEIREEFGFNLYYPNWRRKTESGRPYWPTSLKLGYVELDELRCPRRAKPYLCNGPWAWKNGPKLKWSCGATEPVCWEIRTTSVATTSRSSLAIFSSAM